jgi:hypothetical protein
VNPEKTKYMFVSLCNKAGQKHSTKIVCKSVEDVAEVKYLGRTLTDQNFIYEEIKSRLNSGNSCYHSVQGLLSSLLLSRTVKVKIRITIILPVIYGCETWSLTLREQHGLRSENRVLRTICGPKRDGIRSVVFYTPPQILLGTSNKGE